MGRSSDSTKLSNKKSIDATSSADVDKHSEKMSSSKDVSKEEKRPRKNLFDRLFSQDSMDSGEYSDERDDACSVGSETYYESDSDSDSDEDETEGPSAASSLLRFDRDMRARHRNACKNMTNGKYAKAIKTFEHILSDMLDRFGEEHHRVGAALHNVAVANLRAGLLDDAKDAIEEAIRIRKQTLGHEHPKVADSLVEYGIILLSMKKYDEAIRVFKNAIRLREIEVAVADSREVRQEAQLKMAKIRHNIGCVNFELGDLNEAKQSYTEAIDEQKEVFGRSWTAPFSLLTDTSKPGYLTMASTMCNKGYIELEQGNYKEAIEIFSESLKIQKVLLEANNKLIISTMDNVAYCHCRLGEFDKACPVYNELVKLQSESYGVLAQRGWSQALKRQIFCQIKSYKFEDAFDNLRILEDYLATKGSKTKNGIIDRRRCHKLMGAVNYQIFKFPSLSDYTSRISCGMCADERDSIDATFWFPKKPANGSKMSGHRMTYA